MGFIVFTSFQVNENMVGKAILINLSNQDQQKLISFHYSINVFDLCNSVVAFLCNFDQKRKNKILKIPINNLEGIAWLLTRMTAPLVEATHITISPKKGEFPNVENASIIIEFKSL
jgi:hypothetical protein